MVDGSLSVLNETVQSDVDLGSLKRYPVRKLFATRWDPAGILTASLWDPQGSYLEGDKEGVPVTHHAEFFY